MVTYEQLFDTLRREKSRDELQVLDEGFYGEARRFLDEKRTAAEKERSAASQKAQIEYRNALRIMKELYDRRERKILILAMHKTRTDAAVVDSDALLPEERELFDGIVQTLKGKRKEVLVEDVVSVPEDEGAKDTETDESKRTEDESADTAKGPEQSTQSEEKDDRKSDDSQEKPEEDDAEEKKPESDGRDTPEETVSVTFTAAVPKFVGKDLTVYGPYEEGQSARLPESVAKILVKKGKASTS